MTQNFVTKERANSKSSTLLNFYNKNNPKFKATSQIIHDIDIADNSKQAVKPNTGEVVTARSKPQTDSMQHSVERLNDILGGGKLRRNQIRTQEASSASTFFPSLRTKSDGLINVTATAGHKKSEDDFLTTQHKQIPPKFLLSSSSDWKKYILEQGEGTEKIKQMELTSRLKLEADRKQINTSMSYRHDISHKLDSTKQFKSVGREVRKVFFDEGELDPLNQKNSCGTRYSNNAELLPEKNSDVEMERVQSACLEKNFFAINFFTNGSRKHKRQIKPSKYLTLSNHEIAIEPNGLVNKECVYTPPRTELETQALVQGEEVNLEFLLNLRREVPNSFTEAPSGRQDAILLTRWLDKCVQHLIEKVPPKQGRSSHMQDLLREIHNIALKEVLREVSLQCQERGALLGKIWEFFEKMRKEEERESSIKLEISRKEHEDTSNRIHQFYKRKMDEKEKQLDNIKLEIENTLKQNIDLGRNLAASQQRESELSQKLSEFQKIIQIMKKRLKTMNSVGEKDLGLPLKKNTADTEPTRSRAGTLPNFLKKTSKAQSKFFLENPSNSDVNRSKSEQNAKNAVEKNEDQVGQSDEGQGQGEDRQGQGEDRQGQIELANADANQASAYIQESEEKQDIGNNQPGSPAIKKKDFEKERAVSFKEESGKREKTEPSDPNPPPVKNDIAEVIAQVPINVDEKGINEEPSQEPSSNFEEKVMIAKKRSAESNESPVESEGDDNIEIDNQEFNVNALNNIVINTVAEKLITRADASTEVEPEILYGVNDGKLTQTELTLIGSKFDNAFRNNRNVDEMIDDFVYKKELESLAKEASTGSSNDNFLDKLKEFSLKNFKESEQGNFEEMKKTSLGKSVSPSLKDKKIKGKVKVISKMAVSENRRKSTKNKSLREIIHLEDMKKIVEDAKKNGVEDAKKNGEMQKPKLAEHDGKYVEDLLNPAGVEERPVISNKLKLIKSENDESEFIKEHGMINEESNRDENNEENGNRASVDGKTNEEVENEGLSDFVSDSERELYEDAEELGVINEEEDEQAAIEQDGNKNEQDAAQEANRRVVKLKRDPVTGKLSGNFERKVERRSSSYFLQMEMLKMLKVFGAKSSKLNDIQDKLNQAEDLLNKETQERSNLEKLNKVLNSTLEQEQKKIEKYKEGAILNLGLQAQDSPGEKTADGDRSIKNSGSQTRKAVARKSRGVSTFQSSLALGPKLGQKVTLEFEHKKLAQYGITLVEKVMNKKMSKFKNFMFIKLILKQIMMLYNERISQSKENPFVKEQNMASFAYTVLHSQFGLKKIADQKFIIFILSIRKNLSYFRINMFSRFMNLGVANSNYSVDELNKYLEAMDFILNQSNLGTPAINSEGDSKFYVPFSRALQYTGLFADSRMTPEENNEFKKEIEALKEPDPKAVLKNGIIDFDLFMEKMLSKYRFLVNKAKTYVINAFAASDLDGNGMCNLEEFLLLNRHMEPDKFDEEKFVKIFEESADLENDGEKNLSFNKFSVVCVEHMLFSDEAQDRYLGIEESSKADEIMSNMIKSIRTTWPLVRFEIESRFNNLTVITPDEKDNWLKIISVLDQRITAPDINNLLKPTLIAYNILEKESEMLLESQNDQAAQMKEGEKLAEQNISEFETS